MSVPQEVLAVYNAQRAPVVALDGGLINKTYRVGDGTRAFVLQWLSPIFDPRIHYDIVAVTEHLHRHGMATPTLLRTRDGDLWTTDDAGGVWRAMTLIAGRTLHRATSPAQCHSAGALVGRFHSATAGLEHAFHATRLGVHDTAKHVAALHTALREHVQHNSHGAAASLAEQIFAALVASPKLDAFPLRIVHGDLKLSNILFDQQDNALCLIDLDTLSRMTLPQEMGDALRSWCARADESTEANDFVLDYFAAAVRGYWSAARGVITPDEMRVLGEATRVIALELAARFCRDALEEQYFRWDATRYATASAHNLARTKSQLSLALSIERQRGAIDALLASVVGAG